MPKTPVQLIKDLFDIEQFKTNAPKVTNGGDTIQVGGRSFDVERDQFAVSVRVTEGKGKNKSVQLVALDNEILNLAKCFFNKAAAHTRTKPVKIQPAPKKRVAKKKA